jgi:hypothetical protein
MASRRPVPPRQGRDGKHSYKPTIAVSPEDRAYLSGQLDKLTAYTSEANYLKSLPVAWRTELRESTRWISAGVRHADGKEVHTRHVRADLPSEGELLAKAYALAKEVDALMDRCKAHPTARRQASSSEQA